MFVAVAAGAAPAFSPAAAMSTARVNHTATLLADGTVLIVGGVNKSGLAAGAEIFDPVTATFSRTGNPLRLRYMHTATLLSDGRVLVAGGLGRANMIVPFAELYDPTTRTFSPASRLTIARYGHRATRLNDGRVLITGGYSLGVMPLEAEIYDPDLQEFSVVARTNLPHGGHGAFLLPSGNVLIAGGKGAPLRTELFDPQLATFVRQGDLRFERYNGIGVLLPNGKPILLGDLDFSDGVSEIFDEVSGKFTMIAGPPDCLRLNSATLLKNGTVVLIGGLNCRAKTAQWDHALSTIMLFDPVSNQFSNPGVTMTTARHSHTATLLRDGRVLVVGGAGQTNGALASAELFSP